MTKIGPLVLLVRFLLGIASASSARGAVGEAQRIERLEMLADIWGKLYLFHPRIVSSKVDWNGVLIKTIPQIENATGTDELIAALNDSLFRPLEDPFLTAQRRATVALGPMRKMTARNISEGVGYLDATDPRDYGSDPASRIEDAVRGLGAIKMLIVDLRFAAPQSTRFEWLSLFLDSPQSTGFRVGRVHEGWNEDNGRSTYRQRWDIRPGSSLKPISDTRILQVPTVFVVNKTSYSAIADELDLFQAYRGDAVIFEQRGYQRISSERYLEDVEVRLHSTMLLSKSGNLGHKPDHVSYDPIAEGELAELAGKVLEAKKSRRLAKQAPFAFEMVFPENEPFSNDLLSREQRLLGLFKIWTVISYMDLHVQNASIDWSRALREWIPHVEAAATPQDYFRVLQRLAAQLNDSHIGIAVSTPTSAAGTPLNSRRGPPLRVRPIEGRPVVVAIIKSPAGEEPAVRVGDEILAVDGKSIDELFAERRPLISASTPGALQRNFAGALIGFGGKESVEALVQGETEKRTVTLKTIVQPPPETPISYRVLESGFGYINLDTMTENELEPALEAVAKTKGLILDMRGYPRTGIQWSLVPRISDKPVHSTIWERPVVSNPDKAQRATQESFRWIEPHPTKRYLNPIVVLIDDRAQSAAEDFCIYLRNAKRATFVGTTTAGTNGNITHITLPGGRRMSFTGMRVKFADGGRFQNIGIVPDVIAEPTIRGIRAGRDEVLEKGVETLTALIGQ